MGNIVYAYAIYDGTSNIYVGGDGATVALNCDRVQAFSPRPVWLLRQLTPGDGTNINYVPTFAPSSIQLLDANTLAGFWIEQDGKDVMVDITNATAFLTACDACCGAVPTILANIYGGNAPAFTPLTLNSFCINRLDGGGVNDISQASLDYMDQILGGTLVIKSHITGLSHYSVQSFYSTIVPTGTAGDVIVAGACTS